MAYSKHFLTNVILRIDFVSAEETLKHSLESAVKNVCVKHFPIFEERKVETQQVLVTNEPAIQNTVISKEKSSEWHFFGNEREKELCITGEYIFVDFKEYTSFTDFKAQFFEVLSTLFISYPVLKINRIGLRYIDQIELPPEKKPRKSWRNYWSKYISADLLQGLAMADSDGAITRHMSTLEMNYGNHMLRFQYGIHNQDYPAPNKKNIFILDTDVYATGYYEMEEVAPITDSFHQQSKDWFEKSIKAGLRTVMGIVEDHDN